MKNNNKSVIVPMIIVSTLGWSFFASEAIKTKQLEDSNRNKSIIEDIKEVSISEKAKESHQNFYDEYERLKEEERKRLEEIERQRLLKIEQERLAEIARVEAEKKHQLALEEAKEKELQSKKEVVYDNSSGWVNSQLTHFTAFCPEGCTGTSSSGVWIGDSIYYKEYRIVAASKSIPLYTILQVEYPNGESFKAVVLDRGGAINRVSILDVLVSTESEARNLGRQNGRYKIIGKLNK